MKDPLLAFRVFYLKASDVWHLWGKYPSVEKVITAHT
jgi:hypothetical protein